MRQVSEGSQWRYSYRAIHDLWLALKARPLSQLEVPKRALDLFCGGGGAAKGLHDAGFDVYGIDWTGQPAYPYPMQVERVERLTPEFVAQFDFVWASPPCQRWSTANKAHRNNDSKPDFIPATRELLQASGVPFVIENVPQAPIRADVLLCGSMFPANGKARRLVRHRIFECHGFRPTQPEHHDHHWKYVTVAGTTGSKTSAMPGIGYGRLPDWQEAMGIDWMPTRAMAQAVPPCYAEYLGRQYLAHVRADRVHVLGQEAGAGAGH